MAGWPESAGVSRVAERASDFPGGEWRRMQKPTGMRYILVNGAVTFENNECTGALPGKLLRSYDMID
jgi:N-acyl-D-aspartate/D-glutamate deacylase